MRTSEELTDRLGEERIWRLKEITAVSTLASRGNLPAVEAEFYCRAGAAIFYAHWEGYVKRAATYYLKFLSMQRLSISEMQDFVLCLYMRQKLGSAGQIRSDQLIELSNKLRDDQDYRPKIQWKDRVFTESNLSSSVLRKICDQLGFDYTNIFSSQEDSIDSLILKHRNAIAHGDKGEVDVNTLQLMATSVTALITSFRDAIENAATLRSFKKA